VLAEARGFYIMKASGLAERADSDDGFVSMTCAVCCFDSPMSFLRLAGTVILQLFLGLVAGANAAAPGTGVLRTVAEVRALSEKDAASKHGVSLQGIVTYHDPAWRLLFLEDATGGVAVEVPSESASLARGQTIAVEGATILGGLAPVVSASSWQVLGKATLPAPKSATIRELLAGQYDCQRVEISGVVSAIEPHAGRPLMHIHSGREYLSVLVRDANLGDSELSRFIDAAVRIQGVSATIRRTNGYVMRTQIFAAGLDGVAIDRPAPAAPFDAQETPVSSLSGEESHRVKILGRIVSSRTNGFITVLDEAGTIEVHTGQTAPARGDDMVEVIGFPRWQENKVILEHADYRVVGLRIVHDGAPTGRVYLPLIEGISDVSRLSTEQAALGYPVRLRGQVTFYDAPWHMLFLSDATTNGIFIWPTRRNLGLRPGQIVEINGFTSPGDFVSTVVQAEAAAQALGELPAPQELSYDLLASGQEDSQWIAIDGIVRATKCDGQHLILEVAASGRKFGALVSGYTNAVPPTNLIDAEVRIKGVCSVIPNKRRQAIGFRVCVPSMGHVGVQQAAPVDPFAAPVRTVESLFRYGRQGQPGHRVQVNGVVTMQRDSSALYLRDETGALFVELLQDEKLKPGDRVEVAGFPALVAGLPNLQNAIIRRRGSGSVPEPRAISLREARSGEFDADLVSLEARFLEMSETVQPPVLILRAGDTVFEATLPNQDRIPELQGLLPGSLVKVTGIFSTQVDEEGKVRSFRLLVTADPGVVVLSRPGWLTAGRALTLAGSLSALSLGVMLWVLSLRRRVRQQTELIREKLNQEARLESRYRDLFDTAHDMVFTTDLNGKITSFNKAAEHLAATPRDEAIGCGLRTFFASEDADSWLLPKTGGANEHEPGTYEVTLLAKDGRKVPVEISVTALKQDGKPVGWQGIARDITERRRSEDEIRRFNADLERRVFERTSELAASNKELEAFSYSVSHDLRAPLRAINGFSEILLRDFGASLDDKARHYLQTVAASGRQMGELVDDLLAFSRLGRQPLVKGPVDLNDLVRQVVRGLQRHEPGREVLFLAAHLPPANGDRSLINQVLQNLLGNAWKFTGKTAKPCVEVGSFQQSDEAVFFVRDNGAGFDMQYAGKLFGVFQRLHRDVEFPGTGVGLAIVHRIVSRHGGRVWAEARVGEGATFYFTLPAESATKEP
jgi:PAS domain S-box-containing protein